MKKLILLLCLGIFLISFASATINIYANITRPTFELELTESNETYELNDSTNYYFQCVIGGDGYNGESMSTASEEFNITTNSTHRWINISNIQDMCNSYTVYDSGTSKGVLCRYSINRSFLDWGGEGYMPASFTNNQTLTTQYWLAQYGKSGAYFLPGLKCSNGKDEETIRASDIRSVSQVSSDYIHHPEIAIPKSYRDNLTAGGFNVTQGTLRIDINATGNQTWNDLIKALDNSGYDGLYSNSMYGGLTFIGIISGSGILNITSKSVTQIMNHNVNGNVTFEKGSQHYLELYGAYSASGQGKYYDSSLTINPVTTFSLNSVGGNNIFLVTDIARHRAINFSGWTFTGITNPGTYHENVYSLDGHTSSNSVWNKMYDYVLPTTAGAQNSTIYFINCTFNNNGIDTYPSSSVDINAYNLYLSNCGNYTRDHKMINVISNRPDKRLNVMYSYYALTLWCNSWMNFTFYFDNKFIISQTNGTAINDSNVTLSNEYGVYTGQTNENGYVMLTPISYRTYYNSTQLNYPRRYATYLEMGVYNLSITADGYKDYEAVVNITDKKDWTIALEEQPAWNYSNIPEFKILNNSKHTIFKIDENGNLAIAGLLYENTNSPPPGVNIIWRILDFLWIDDMGNLYIKGLIYLLS